MHIKCKSNPNQMGIWFAFDVHLKGGFDSHLILWSWLYSMLRLHEQQRTMSMERSHSLVHQSAHHVQSPGHNQTKNFSLAMKVGVPGPKLAVPRHEYSAYRHNAPHGKCHRHAIDPNGQSRSFVWFLLHIRMRLTVCMVLSWRRPYNRYYSCLTCFW